VGMAIPFGHAQRALLGGTGQGPWRCPPRHPSTGGRNAQTTGLPIEETVDAMCKAQVHYRPPDSWGIALGAQSRCRHPAPGELSRLIDHAGHGPRTSFPRAAECMTVVTEADAQHGRRGRGDVVAEGLPDRTELP
jgi:hypothetical protein